MDGRPDPKKSTVTLYYQQRAQSARPTITRVPAGPGVKLVAGELRSAYEDRPVGKLVMGHTADFAEIKKAYMQSSASAAAAPPHAASAPMAAAPPQQPAIATHIVDWGRSSVVRPSSAGSASTTTTTRTKRVIYWDGKSHHVVEAPDAPGFRWVAPHLKGGDVNPGPQLGVRETPGTARVKLIGSKFRYLPTMEPGGTSMWAISPSEAAKYGSTGTLSSTGGSSASGSTTTARPLTASIGSAAEYARAKGVGSLEYEAAARMLNGVGSWEKTQQHLMSSVQVGRPSRLLGASEQMRAVSAPFTGLKAAAAAAAR